MTDTGTQPKRILLVGPAWLGDAVMAHGLVQMLSWLWPDAEIDVLAPKSLLPLYQMMPETRSCVILPVDHGDLDLIARWRVGRGLRAGAYEMALIVSRSFKAALPPWVAHIPERRGFTGELRYGLVNRRISEPDARTPTLERFASLLPEWQSAPPHPELRPTSRQISETCAKFGLDAHAGALVLCPGAAADAAKRWPARNFAALARSYLHSGRSAWMIGAASDRETAHIIQNEAPDIANLTGHTDLAEAAALLAAAGRVVANDSGLMHLAAAVGAPVLGLYGPTDPTINPPLSARALTLRAPVRDAGSTPSIAELEPSRVFAALEAL